MLPKIKKILYATDLSKNSAYAFQYALDSAVHHGADIHILHVLETRFLSFLPPVFEGTEMLNEGCSHLEEMKEHEMEKRRLAKENIQERLRDFYKEEMRSNSALYRQTISVEITEGDAAAQILRRADELPADQLIMGTHGKGRLVHTFLGSVAESVLHRIKIPVLIIPLPPKKGGRR
jgi:nucleotide-binding universal stress UspA family protein